MNGTLKKLKEITRYDVEVLPNGAKLITHYRPGLSVNISVNFSYGSGYETPDKRQASHFAEHMFFKKGSREKYMARIEELETISANGWNASTGVESIRVGNNGVFVALPHKAERLVRILGEMLYDEGMEDEFFEAERQVLLNELAHTDNSEYERFVRQSWDLFWGSEHPYAAANYPYLDSLRKLTKDDINEVFGFLCGSNTAVSIVGDYDQDTLRSARDVFGTRHCVKEKRPIPPPTGNTSLQLTGRPADIKEPYIRVMFRLPGENHPDLLTAHMLQRYLDDTSRLERILRDEASLCYSTYVDKTDFSMGSAFSIVVTRFPEENVTRILDCINSEIEKLKSGDIDGAVLRRLEESAEGTVICFESGEYSAKIFASTELFCYKNPYDYFKAVMAITQEDMQRLSQTYFLNPVTAVGLKG